MFFSKILPLMGRKTFESSNVELKELRVLNRPDICADTVRALLSLLPSFQIDLQVLYSLVEIRRPFVWQNACCGLILGSGKYGTLLLASVQFQMLLLKVDDVALRFEPLR